MRKLIESENIISALIGVACTMSLCAYMYREELPKQTDIEIQDPITTVESTEAPTEITSERPTEETTTEYKEHLGLFKVTAYCACEKCCPGTSDGITYTGTIATEGRTIAVDPNVIELGSIIELNGVKYVAEDVGGVIKGNKLDLYFNNHEDALKWGVQYHDVYLLKE